MASISIMALIIILDLTPTRVMGLIPMQQGLTLTLTPPSTLTPALMRLFQGHTKEDTHLGWVEGHIEEVQEGHTEEGHMEGDRMKMGTIPHILKG